MSALLFMGYTLHTLSNGLRLAYKRVPGTRLVHCGYVIHAGSRNDLELPGLAHCLEHMVFKGTQKRRNIHVLNHIEVVGGEMNAFTTKEITAIYATVQNTHFLRAADILTDITFNSTIPLNELEKEKKVIADEILMYLDTPEENIYDEFHEIVYGKHPLAHNILGNPESLKKITRTDILRFTQTWYKPENMVFAVVGNISLNRVLHAMEKFTAELVSEKFEHDNRNQAPSEYSPTALTKETDFSQAYCILGLPTYHDQHPGKWRLRLLTNLLGGPGLNSRLNLAIREKHGFTYHIEAGYQAYSDSGLFHCYFSSDMAHMRKATELVLKEIQKLKTQQMGSLQFSRYKNQFIGQLVMADENRSGLMIHLGKNILSRGTAPTLDDIVAEVEKITVRDLLETANEVLNHAQFSYLNYVPA